MPRGFVGEKAVFSNGKPLSCGMDNVLASRLGRVAYNIKKVESLGGDSIDAGLLLRRLLEEAGFHVSEIH